MTKLLLCCALVLAATSTLATAAGETGATSITLLAHTHGDQHWWTIEGQDARNPPLVVAPNANITLRMRNVDDGVHNLVVAGLARAPYVNEAGEEATLTFTSPESGIFEYYCEPHRAYGMRGTVRVAGTPEPQNETPSPALATASAAAVVAAASMWAWRGRAGLR